MNNHLKVVREYHDACSYAQAEHGANANLSEMDVIIRQALLMEAGSEALKAIKAGDMVEILVGLIDIAYYALGAVAVQGKDVMERQISWRHDGSVISVMRLLSDKINRCATGKTDNYSELYCSCIHLARSFLNADFDKAFKVIHDSNMAMLNNSGKTIYDDTGKIEKSRFVRAPDLSDCLYE